MWENVKKYALYIIVPFGALLAIIQYLLGKNQQLKQESARKDAEKDIAVTLAKKDEATKESLSKEEEYKKALEAFNEAMKNDK